jgi:hypothetical protein
VCVFFVVVGFCVAIGNNALRVTVVDVFRGSLVQDQVGTRRRTKTILLRMRV